MEDFTKIKKAFVFGEVASVLQYYTPQGEALFKILRPSAMLRIHVIRKNTIPDSVMRRGIEKVKIL